MDESSIGVKIKCLGKLFPIASNKSEMFYDINKVDLDIEPGNLLTLLGPSGCGKTTILRMIAGFLIPDESEIYIGNKKSARLFLTKEILGMMFQSYVLFPHMNVFDNVAYGLKLKNFSRSEIQDKVKNILTLMQLADWKTEYQMNYPEANSRVSLKQGLL